MDERSRSLYGAAGTFILLCLLTDTVHAQTSAGAGQGIANSGSQTAADNQGAGDAGSLDKLLDMADKDVGQLSNVNVSGHTGSPSLDQPVSTVERQKARSAKRRPPCSWLPTK